MAAARGWVSPSVLPGFGLTLGFAGMFLAAIVLVPMAALVMKGHLSDGIYSGALAPFLNVDNAL